MTEDPMWDVFRERHPDVNLVILPAELASPEDEAEPAAAEAPVAPADAVSELTALSRRAALIAETLGIEVRIASGFSRVSPAIVQGHVDASATEHASEPIDPATLSHHLERLGWNTRVRPAEGMAWVDLSSSDATGRVVISPHATSIRIDGPLTPVTETDADLLQEVRDV